MQKNKIVLAGGSGYIGQTLVRYFSGSGSSTKQLCEVVVLTRDKKRIQDDRIKYVYWDGKTLGEWAHELEGARAVINLSGRTVNCRYNQKNKAEILASRLDSTRVIGRAIQQCTQAPAVWINAGSATIYRHSTDKQMTEENGEFHNDFSVQVCKAWEKTFNDITVPHTRKVFLRIAITLGNGGGVFKTLHGLTRVGLGGRHGSGLQFISWIHEQDLCRIMCFAIENENIYGVYNAAAPNPERNKTFMQLLRKKTGAWWGLPQPVWLLNIGTRLMGTEKELVLKSRNVVPERLFKAGFVFKFNTLEEAMEDLLK